MWPLRFCGSVPNLRIEKTITGPHWRPRNQDIVGYRVLSPSKETELVEGLGYFLSLATSFSVTALALLLPKPVRMYVTTAATSLVESVAFHAGICPL